jgi:hypothetical protein
LYVSETNGVVTKGYGSTRERKRCFASGAETKRPTRLAEDRSRIEDARSNSWAECRENNFGIEPRGAFSLDIPFYRIVIIGKPPPEGVGSARPLLLGASLSKGSKSRTSRESNPTLLAGNASQAVAPVTEGRREGLARSTFFMLV